MTSSRDVDVAKDRLVDSLSVARDATRTAVKDDIAPAVVAAVGAAREASGPLAAEAASRASDAVSALRGTGSEAAKALRQSDVAAKIRKTDVAKAVRDSDAVNKALRRDRRTGRNRWTMTALLVAAGVVAGTLAKRRKQASTSYPPPNAYPTPAPTDSTAQSSAMDMPVADPTAETPTKKK